MRSRLTAVAVGLTLSLTGAATAHATAQTPTKTPTIFMLDTLRDAGNNPHLVYTSCGDDNRALIHTVLYNDHGGPDETVVVYLEPSASGLNTLGVPVQNAQAIPSPIDIPAGGHAAITLPFENGSAVFDAVAVAKGGTVPTTAQQLEAAETAKTADNSQLFAPGSGTNGKYEYPAAPTGCTPPPWHPCPPNWPIDLYPVIQTCPVYVPPVTQPSTSQPSTHPTTHPTTKPSTSPSITHTTTAATTPPKPVTHTSTMPSETPQRVTGTADATSPPVTALSTTAAASLAHTGGSSSTPLIVAALLLIVTGGTLMVAGLRKRGQHR
jgi:hypothetical protein